MHIYTHQIQGEGLCAINAKCQIQHLSGEAANHQNK